jgi:hypothetical protein
LIRTDAGIAIRLCRRQLKEDFYMPEITVWTKQNEAVVRQLEADGRFIADERCIRRELENTADIMLFIYSWLAEHAPITAERPADVRFPVWVSFSEEAVMMPEPGYVILELSVDGSLLTSIDTAKWTRITNYSYIPDGRRDAEEHRRHLEELRINDADAIMTCLYPDMRREIISSWDRLFDKSISLGSDTAYGIMWEVREEWIRKIIM